MAQAHGGALRTIPQVTAPRLIEIPMFNHEESLDVAALFEQHAIHYRKDVVHLGPRSAEFSAEF